MKNFLETHTATLRDCADHHLEQFHRAVSGGNFNGSIKEFARANNLPRFTIEFQASAGLAPQYLPADIEIAPDLNDGADVLVTYNPNAKEIVAIKPSASSLPVRQP